MGEASSLLLVRVAAAAPAETAVRAATVAAARAMVACQEAAETVAEAEAETETVVETAVVASIRRPEQAAAAMEGSSVERPAMEASTAAAALARQGR